MTDTTRVNPTSNQPETHQYLDKVDGAKEHTPAGKVIEFVRDEFSTKPSDASAAAKRASQNDTFAESIADTAAMLPGFVGLVGTVLRPILLHDSNKSALNDVKNLAEGVALHFVSKAALGLTTREAAVTAETTMLLNMSVLGAGTGVVKTGLEPANWRNEDGSVSLYNGTRNMLEAGAFGAGAGLALGGVGYLGNQLVSSVGSRLSSSQFTGSHFLSNSLIEPALKIGGVGYVTGFVSGGISSYRKQGNFADALSDANASGLMGMGTSLFATAAGSMTTRFTDARSETSTNAPVSNHTRDSSPAGGNTTTDIKTSAIIESKPHSPVFVITNRPEVGSAQNDTVRYYSMNVPTTASAGAENASMNLDMIPLTKFRFLKQISALSKDEGEVGIYFHGVRNAPNEAALDAALIGRGKPMVVLDWASTNKNDMGFHPSRWLTTQVESDYNSAWRSQQFMTESVKNLGRLLGYESLHLYAHSAGALNQGRTLAALQTTGESVASATWLHPDIKLKDFVAAFPFMHRAADSMNFVTAPMDLTLHSGRLLDFFVNRKHYLYDSQTKGGISLGTTRPKDLVGAVADHVHSDYFKSWQTENGFGHFPAPHVLENLSRTSRPVFTLAKSNSVNIQLRLPALETLLDIQNRTQLSPEIMAQTGTLGSIGPADYSAIKAMYIR